MDKEEFIEAMAPVEEQMPKPSAFELSIRNALARIDLVYNGEMVPFLEKDLTMLVMVVLEWKMRHAQIMHDIPRAAYYYGYFMTKPYVLADEGFRQYIHKEYTPWLKKELGF